MMTWLRRVAVVFLMAGVLLGATQAKAQGTAPKKDYTKDPMQLLIDCLEKQKTVIGNTATVTKRERIDGTLREAETMFIKCRCEPLAVYFKWVKNPKKDREALYCQGKYDNKVLGHQPLGPINIEAKMDPNSKDALKESLRPITQASFRTGLELLVKLTSHAKAAGDLNLFCIENDTYNGRPAYCLLRKLPKKPEYPYFFTYIYVDKEWMVPTHVAFFDSRDNLLCSYSYADVKLNVPLTDADFDKDNPSYNWPAFIFQKIKL